MAYTNSISELSKLLSRGNHIFWENSIFIINYDKLHFGLILIFAKVMVKKNKKQTKLIQSNGQKFGSYFRKQIFIQNFVESKRKKGKGG
jgi:hypothetical protein